MKVLVTGATGFVGRFLVRALVAEGHDVTAVVRPTSPTERLRGIPVRVVVADLTQPRPLDGLMDGVEWVFHVAGDLSWWRGHRHRQWAVNVEGTRRVVAEALRAGVRRLVHTSSVAAVGFPLDGELADEAFPFNGHRLGLQYAVTKWEAERRVLEGVERGLDAVIVNPATILGDDAPRPGSLVDLAARGRLPAWVEGGTTFCHIDDVVAGHLAAARRGRTGQRYILGGHNVTFRRIIEALAQAAGRRPPARRAPRGLVWAAAWALEGAAALTRRPPPLTRDHARLVGRSIYYSSGRAIAELGYAVTPLATMVQLAVSRGLRAPER